MLVERKYADGLVGTSAVPGIGSYHLSVPRDLIGNLRFRKYVLERSLRSAADRKAIWHACRADVLFFLSVFCWQSNPKAKGLARLAPFIPYSFQEELLTDLPETTGKKGILWCYARDKTSVVEKSRDMGASWLFLYFQLWLCLFHENCQVLNISRNADAVDDGTPDSLFWKLDYAVAHMPRWLVGEFVRNRMQFEFKRMRSWITGEASTGRAGVGGRATVIFVDEFSKIREDSEIRQYTANTADCRFFNGTHTGTASEFFKMTRSPEIVQLRVHWVQHPEKNKGLYSWDGVNQQFRYWKYNPASRDLVECKKPDWPLDFEPRKTPKPEGGPFPGIRSPWYDRKSDDIGSDRAIAQDLDINPEGAASQVFNPGMVQTYKSLYCREPFAIGKLHYSRASGLPDGFYEAAGGDLKLWCRLHRDRPEPARYTIGIDVSHGTGHTPSCCSVWNADTMTKVAEFSNNMLPPPDFAMLVCALGRWFGWQTAGEAKLGWEINGPGAAMGKQVIMSRYWNYYCDEDEVDSLVNGSRTNNRRPGWYSNPDRKTTLIGDYHAALARHQVVNPSREAIDETLQYIYDGSSYITHGKARAKSNDPSSTGQSHGDLVIADALGVMMARRANPQGNALTPTDPRLPDGISWRMRMTLEQSVPANPYGWPTWSR